MAQKLENRQITNVIYTHSNMYEKLEHLRKPNLLQISWIIQICFTWKHRVDKLSLNF